MPIYKTIAKVAAVLAILGLVLSSFALTVGAQSPVALERASACASFNRDLTVGSQGADVTALQNWLISKGIAIPAGATGYFGAQTRGALARLQAQEGITPAAGYFGPITRAKVNGCKPETPQGQDDKDDDEEEQEIEITAEIRSGGAYIEAEVDGEESSFTVRGTRRSVLIEEIAEHLDLTEKEVKAVIEFTEADEDEDDAEVTTDAEVNDRDGADNDNATFTIAFDLTAFGEDAYVAKNPSTSITYEIQDADGDAVGGATSQTAVLRSTADEEGSYFHIEEGDAERLTLTVAYDPLAADEGNFYRLAVTRVHFNETDAAPNRTWNVTPDEDFRTDYVYIAD